MVEPKTRDLPLTVGEPRMPLSGIRVADFSWVGTGPWCTRYLAAMGAEVIKIENGRRFDFTRTSGPFAEGVPGTNRSGYFNLWNQGKKSCTIDLATEKGRDVARRLVEISDVAVENFGFGTMEKLGLSYPDLRQVRSDLIMLSLSGYGRTGPDKEYLAYGRNLHAASGLTYLTGYPGGPPRGVTVIWGDVISGTTAAYAILVALYHRRKTGIGQYIDVAMLEATAFQLPEAVMDYVMNGRETPRSGNLDETMAPHNCYRCLGDDRWCAIAVTNESWPVFCQAIGKPELCHDGRFSDLLKRLENRDELDRIVTEWTTERTVWEVADTLQRCEIASGPSADLEDLLGDESLFERGSLVRLTHPEVGVRVGVGLPWQMSGVPNPHHQAAPLFGQDDEYVFRALLGLSSEELTSLAQDGAVGWRAPDR